jgi:hypothetical protein
VRIETLLQRLEAEQSAMAVEAMERPSGKTEFDYGRAVGIYAGLQRAKEVLLNTVAEAEKRDFL